MVEGQCYISLYSMPKAGSHTPGRGLLNSPPNYQAEAEGLLHDLDKLLGHSNSSKARLIKVDPFCAAFKRLCASMEIQGCLLCVAHYMHHQHHQSSSSVNWQVLSVVT